MLVNAFTHILEQFQMGLLWEIWNIVRKMQKDRIPSPMCQYSWSLSLVLLLLLISKSSDFQLISTDWFPNFWLECTRLLLWQTPHHNCQVPHIVHQWCAGSGRSGEIKNSLIQFNMCHSFLYSFQDLFLTNITAWGGGGVGEVEGKAQPCFVNLVSCLLSSNDSII
jgi:hypothetical protein